MQLIAVNTTRTAIASFLKVLIIPPPELYLARSFLDRGKWTVRFTLLINIQALILRIR